MGCLSAILWLPLLAVGGVIGFWAGSALGGDAAGVIGAVVGIIVSQGIQLWLFRSRRPTE